MNDAPGPEDPRYWERLRRGPPLDEWVSASKVRDPPKPAYRGWRVWVPLAAIVLAFVAVVALVNRDTGSGKLTFSDMPVCTQPVTIDPCRDGAAVVYRVNGTPVTFPTYEAWLAYVNDSADPAEPLGNPTAP